MARKTFRTGRQMLLRFTDSDGHTSYYMRLINRRSDTTVEVPEERVAAWLNALK